MSEEKVLTLRGKKAVWAPGGGASSWNDLKDKPFGVVGTEVVFDQTLVFEEYPEVLLDAPLNVSAGDALTVEWNGTKYEVAVEAIFNPFGNPAVAFGDIAALEAFLNGGDRPEQIDPPFAYKFDGAEYDYGTFYAFDGAGSYTVKVAKMFIETIDPKFLPDVQKETPIQVLFTVNKKSDGNHEYECQLTEDQFVGLAETTYPKEAKALVLEDGSRYDASAYSGEISIAPPTGAKAVFYKDGVEVFTIFSSGNVVFNEDIE